MPKLTRAQILTEPPGNRRAYLALRSVDLEQGDIAHACNCSRSMVSHVIAGRHSTSDLYPRIRQAIASRTGFEQSWLFAHADKPSQANTITSEHSGLAA